MTEHLLPEALADIPVRGWMQEATPVERWAELGGSLGLAWLGVKRDDASPGLVGGSKTRKLDYLLAAAPWRDAEGWASIGAIGSGHLVSLSAAASQLDRRIEFGCFWEQPEPEVLGNLAYTASGPARITYLESRVGLALRHPGLLLAARWRGLPVIPPGASTPLSLIGMVRAGLELGVQVRDGQLPAPQRIVLPLGSGGTAAGLAVGLSLAGLDARVHCVTAVERYYTSLWRLRSSMARCVDVLRGFGVDVPLGFRPAPVHFDRRFLGAGYGLATVASREACRLSADLGTPLEPIYSGKALSAILAASEEMRGERVLFWQTCHGGELPSSPGWRDRLPARLAAHLATPRRGPTRRRLLALGAVAASAAFVPRLLLYPAVPSWQGGVLSAREAQVVAAAAEVVLPEGASQPSPRIPSPWEVTANIDSYLRGMPPPMLIEVHAMLILLEQGTLLDGSIHRLTALDPSGRLSFLGRLTALGGPLAQASRGIRDLCLLGYYQDPRSWAGIGYGGPLLQRPRPSAIRDQLAGSSTRYAALLAPAGAVPRSWTP